MSPNNQQPELSQEALKLERNLAQLEAELKNCIAAGALMATDAGQVLVRFLTARINLHMKKITSKDFMRDHGGYVACLEALNEDKWLLNTVQVAATPNVAAKFKAKSIEVRRALDGGTE